MISIGNRARLEVRFCWYPTVFQLPIFRILIRRPGAAQNDTAVSSIPRALGTSICIFHQYHNYHISSLIRAEWDKGRKVRLSGHAMVWDEQSVVSPPPPPFVVHCIPWINQTINISRIQSTIETIIISLLLIILADGCTRKGVRVLWSGFQPNHVMVMVARDCAQVSWYCHTYYTRKYWWEYKIVVGYIEWECIYVIHGHRCEHCCMPRGAALRMYPIEVESVVGRQPSAQTVTIFEYIIREWCWSCVEIRRAPFIIDYEMSNRQIHYDDSIDYACIYVCIWSIKTKQAYVYIESIKLCLWCDTKAAQQQCSFTNSPRLNSTEAIHKIILTSLIRSDNYSIYEYGEKKDTFKPSSSSFNNTCCVVLYCMLNWEKNVKWIIYSASWLNHHAFVMNTFHLINDSKSQSAAPMLIRNRSC